MAKRSFRGKPAKKKAAGSPNDMLAQMQKMQQEMAAAQAALENETMTITAGGGAITIAITGHQRVKNIIIDKELLDPDEAEFLQDMLVAGINAAIEQSPGHGRRANGGYHRGRGRDGWSPRRVGVGLNRDSTGTAALGPAAHR
jgi:nucleoid-associated protein EbfC